MDPFNYSRRVTSTVNIGDTPLGSEYPVRVQSMTSTSTLDTEGSVSQAIRICNAGAAYVRLTAQGVREAENIGKIRSILRSRGYNVPLVADIHFNPRAAFAAAAVTDKVRINPGNFVDAARTFKQLTYTDKEYEREIEKIRNVLVPFLDVCKQHHTAIRLGVNHGSLSDRIMSRYGDTPQGMVESAMEFLRISTRHNFSDVVISIKSSNTVVMVETVRRMVKAMDAENMSFPLHLGVTEAGDGEDGRIKSAVGIGALLSEGIGDTIRVSLSEDPELEVPVANKLVEYITSRSGHGHIHGGYYKGYNALSPSRRKTHKVKNIGGGQLPVIIAACNPEDLKENLKPDYYYVNSAVELNETDSFIVPYILWNKEKKNQFPLFDVSNYDLITKTDAAIKWLAIDTAKDSIPDLPDLLKSDDSVVLLLSSSHKNMPGSQQAFLHSITDYGVTSPIVIMNIYSDKDREWLQVKSSADFGSLLLNGFSDGIFLYAPDYGNPDDVVRYEYAILQAVRQRISKTEFISCPGCGRTLFDLQNTVKRVKEATSHLKHLKIGIMGCVVNGPGEMADADYGYVGAAVGKISLYKGKTCIEKNIPEADAIEHLVNLIKENNDWIDP